MVEVLLFHFIQLTSIIISVVGLVIALKIYNDFRNMTSIRLIVIHLFLVFWTISIYLSNLLVQQIIPNDIPHPRIQIIAELAISFLFAAFAMVSYIQINPIYSKRVRLMGVMALTSFSILVGFTLSEVEGTHDFINFMLVENIWIARFNILYNICIFVGILSFSLSYYFSSRFLERFPDYLLSKQKFYFSQPFIYGLSLIMLIAFFIFSGGSYQISGYTGLFMELIVTILALIYIYSSYEQPFLQIGYGANPIKLLEHNFIGYFIGSSLDTGPTILKKSKGFFERSGINNLSLEGLNVGIMTLVGINNSFREQLAIVPLPQNDDFMSISFSFFIQNPDVEDTRVKNQAPSVLGIIVPTVMSLSLKGINAIKIQIKHLFAEYDHIEKLSDERMNKLVSKILHELLY